MRTLHLCVFVCAAAAYGMYAATDEKTPQTESPPPIVNRVSVAPRFPSPFLRKRVTPAMRDEAAKKQNNFAVKALATPGPGGQPNYFGPVPNYANSPLTVVKTTKSGKVKSVTGIRKFVDSLPGLGSEHQNNLGQFIPVAVANTNAFPGSDYYEIGVVQYQRQMHSDLNPTTLRGYVQLGAGIDPVGAAQYLGPLIIAQKDRPVRVKLSNLLPTGPGGNLFLPVDPSVMGAGLGPDMTNMYTQNRTVLHLHGGATPWISDGTPHQWITPQGEVTPYVQGVSVQPVPDMPLPTVGDGTATYYYTNAQSSRMMFYHDHSYGITRLNIYAGEAAGYILTDPAEENLINQHIIPSGKGVYRYGTPLIIQDRTFVPPHNQLVQQDPTWNWLTSSGSLWFPHVYMPNQNTNLNSGVNPVGRWDYGPWIWPPFNAGAGLINGPILDPNGSGLIVPGTPNPSIVPEAFMDTPVVNGTAYPYLNVKRHAYRFRILNASNDRFWNLQLYYADPLAVSVVNGGYGYEKAPKVVFKGGKKAKGDFEKPKATATIENGVVTAVTVTNPGSGYITAPQVIFKGHSKKPASAIASVNTEVRMIPASVTENVPPYYPTMDGRAGGVPDPTMSGPSMIQIGNEGGLLPAPVVLPNTPIGYDYNRRTITVLNVLQKTLFLGPAERADVIIDFSSVPKNVSTVILYNDAPAPVPGFDPRYDYYTNDPDQTSTGGAPTTLAGLGPNTRTVMQFRVSGKKKNHFNLKALQSALPAAYVASQPAPVVPETTYPAPYQATSDTYSRIQDTSLTFLPVGQTVAITQPMLPKSIIESFDLTYGRMNAMLGAEMTFTNDGTQTSVPLEYRDPPVEYITNNGNIQLWKVTHNGVDTHAIHTHLFNMQLVNRVAWDGTITPPDPNELGWKETIRMNPLEDIIVALRPVTPPTPFASQIPNSVRLWDPTMMTGMTWSSFDPNTGAAVTWTNSPQTFGWEYVWHCHLLGHEENDMMRPISFNLQSTPPILNGTPVVVGTDVTFSISPPVGTTPVSYEVTYVGSTGALQSFTYTGNPQTITITGLSNGQTYTFTVVAVYPTGQGTSMPLVFQVPV